MHSVLLYWKFSSSEFPDFLILSFGVTGLKPDTPLEVTGPRLVNDGMHLYPKHTVRDYCPC